MYDCHTIYVKNPAKKKRNPSIQQACCCVGQTLCCAWPYHVTQGHEMYINAGTVWVTLVSVQVIGTWRIKSNEELNRLTGNKNIINYIKAQRLAWFGHVLRMPDDSMVKRGYEWSPALTRSVGRPKNRWEDDVKSDVANVRITNWKDCVRNRSKWKEFVEKAKTSPKL